MTSADLEPLRDEPLGDEALRKDVGAFLEKLAAGRSDVVRVAVGSPEIGRELARIAQAHGVSVNKVHLLAHEYQNYAFAILRQARVARNRISNTVWRRNGVAPEEIDVPRQIRFLASLLPRRDRKRVALEAILDYQQEMADAINLGENHKAAWFTILYTWRFVRMLASVIRSPHKKLSSS